ncbi:MAG: hypothetical protein WCI73_05115 [Phycisphaerae bacterium]
MKHDTQHLEFLVSQYVDNTLDQSNRKVIEQRLARDTTAQAILKEHREVQEVLEDWGSRIPLIDWNAFDRKLADQLGREEIAAVRASKWQQWMRPLAAAAGIALAVGGGYGWHAFTQEGNVGGGSMVQKDPSGPSHSFRIDDEPLAGANSRAVKFLEDPAVRRSTTVPGSASLANNVTIHSGPAESIVDRRMDKPIPGAASAEAPVTQPALDTLR